MKRGIQIIAVLLIACLIGDPASAYAFRDASPLPRSNVHIIPQLLSQGVFQHEAVVEPPVASPRLPVEDSHLKEIVGRETAGLEPTIDRPGFQTPQNPQAELLEAAPPVTPPTVVVADKIDVSQLGISGVIDVSKVKEKTGEIIRLNPTILIVRSATIVDEELMKQLPNLKVVIRAGHGVDNVDMKYAEAHGIRVYNTGGSQDSVAALAMRMTARAKQGKTEVEHDAAPRESFYTVPEWEAAFENKAGKILGDEKARLEGKWADIFRPISDETIQSLRGKTMGIIGFGRIGQKIAAVASALGMNVLAYSPTLGQNPGRIAQSGARVATQEEIYQESNFSVLIPELIKEGSNKNVGLVDQQATAILKRNLNFKALINVARGALVNENAMLDLMMAREDIQYLVDDVPKSAYLQVHALYTPHIGASTNAAEKSVVAATRNVLVSVYEELSAAAASSKPVSRIPPALIYGGRAAKRINGILIAEQFKRLNEELVTDAATMERRIRGALDEFLSEDEWPLIEPALLVCWDAIVASTKVFYDIPDDPKSFVDAATFIERAKEAAREQINPFMADVAGKHIKPFNPAALAAFLANKVVLNFDNIWPKMTESDQLAISSGLEQVLDRALAGVYTVLKVQQYNPEGWASQKVQAVQMGRLLAKIDYPRIDGDRLFPKRQAARGA